ncbi:MAG: UrcA family protein [Pseudomonadota bacterium]|nr:UrcA family protein [Pseudomonadota bacterium]
MPRLIPTTLALTLLCAPASQALTPPPSIEIELDRSELADPDRLSALQSQIRDAARRVCREYVIGDLLRAYTLHDCIEATTAQAMSQLEALRTAGRSETGIPHNN